MKRSWAKKKKKRNKRHANDVKKKQIFMLKWKQHEIENGKYKNITLCADEEHLYININKLKHRAIEL